MSLSLTVLLLAPSIVILDNDQNSFAIEHGEDENNKEEKKEINENDPFLEHTDNAFVFSDQNTLDLSLAYLTYLEIQYSTTIEVFLPPPKAMV